MKTKEFKLGFFILGALIILIMGIFSIRDFRVLNPGYTIKVIFNFGDGIKSASPVRVAGTDSGEVKKVSLMEEEGKIRVLIHAWIRKGTRIPKNSEAFVNSLGILGEKYLEILPNDSSQDYLKDGDIIVGKDSYPMYKISELARKTLIRFDKLLDSIHELVKDEELSIIFKKFVGNLRDASSNLDGFLKDLRNPKGTVGKLVYEDTLYQDIKEFIKDLKVHPWKLLYKPDKTGR